MVGNHIWQLLLLSLLFAVVPKATKILHTHTHPTCNFPQRQESEDIGLGYVVAGDPG